MLPRSGRISKTLFTEVITHGNVFHSPHFSLRVYKQGGNNSAFAVAASKKIVTTATKRNLVKRRVYHVIRKYRTNIKSSFACIIFVKKSILEIPFLDFENELKQILLKAQVLKVE